MTGWWFASFGGPDGALGGAYVEAADAVEADAKLKAYAPDGADEILIIGPISPADVEENVPTELREKLIPAGHEHLSHLAPRDVGSLSSLARESGYEAHVHILPDG